MQLLMQGTHNSMPSWFSNVSIYLIKYIKYPPMATLGTRRQNDIPS